MFCGFAYGNYIPYNISCGTMLLYQVGLTFSGISMLTGMLLVVSVLSKNHVISLIISAILVFLPLVNTDLIQQVNVLLPIKQLQFSELMSVSQIKGNLLYALLAFPLSLVMIVIGTLLARNFWRNRQCS